jgi:hypothetical protein
MLLHPRVPPLVRSLPHVESLSLFHTEESQDEAEAREILDLTYREASSHPEPPPSIQEDQMEDGTRLPLVESDSKESPILQAYTTLGRPSSSGIEQSEIGNGLSLPPKFSLAPSSYLPPEPGLAPQNSIAPIDIIRSSAPQLHPVTIVTSMSDEEDEEMPAINLDSDSDGN